MDAEVAEEMVTVLVEATVDRMDPLVMVLVVRVLVREETLVQTNKPRRPLAREDCLMLRT